MYNMLLASLLNYLVLFIIFKECLELLLGTVFIIHLKTPTSFVIMREILIGELYVGYGVSVR